MPPLPHEDTQSVTFSTPKVFRSHSLSRRSIHYNCLFINRQRNIFATEVGTQLSHSALPEILIGPVLFCPPFACLQCKGWAITMTLSLCLSVYQYQGLLTNYEETERLTNKVLEIKVVGHYQTNSGVPSAVTFEGYENDYRHSSIYLHYSSLLILFTFVSFSVP
jgi:hypothetical protein